MSNNTSNLKKFREMSGMTQKELAEEAGVNFRMIGPYEQGVKDINKASAETLFKISEILCCDMEDLVEKDKINALNKKCSSLDERAHLNLAMLYEKVFSLLDIYFQRDAWQPLFLHGGCFWFAEFLHNRLPGSCLMINRQQEHCALYYHGHIYDIRGKISGNKFHKATKREISFMRKNYKPQFEVEPLEIFLKKQLGEEN